MTLKNKVASIKQNSVEYRRAEVPRREVELTKVWYRVIFWFTFECPAILDGPEFNVINPLVDQQRYR